MYRSALLTDAGMTLYIMQFLEATIQHSYIWFHMKSWQPFCMYSLGLCDCFQINDSTDHGTISPENHKK